MKDLILLQTIPLNETGPKSEQVSIKSGVSNLVTTTAVDTWVKQQFEIVI